MTISVEELENKVTKYPRKESRKEIQIGEDKNGKPVSKKTETSKAK